VNKRWHVPTDLPQTRIAVRMIGEIPSRPSERICDACPKRAEYRSTPSPPPVPTGDRRVHDAKPEVLAARVLARFEDLWPPANQPRESGTK
jgi:hypothetical protein